MTLLYLFINWERGGNVPPVLGIARQFAACGHTAHMLTKPCLQESVQAASARFILFNRHFVWEKVGGNLERHWQAGSPIAALKNQLDSIFSGLARIVAEETQHTGWVYSPFSLRTIFSKSMRTAMRRGLDAI